jgi:hypothetical protein
MKKAGALRRSVRFWTFAEILGRRRMKCAYFLILFSPILAVEHVFAFDPTNLQHQCGNPMKLLVFSAVILSSLVVSGQEGSLTEKLTAAQGQATSVGSILSSRRTSDILKRLRQNDVRESTIETLQKITSEMGQLWDKQAEEFSHIDVESQVANDLLAKVRAECQKVEKKSCQQLIEAASEGELRLLASLSIQINASYIQSPICMVAFDIGPKRANRIAAIISKFEQEIQTMTAGLKDAKVTPDSGRAFQQQVAKKCDTMIGSVYGNLTDTQLEEVLRHFQPRITLDEFKGKLPVAAVEAMKKERETFR